MKQNNVRDLEISKNQVLYHFRKASDSYLSLLYLCTFADNAIETSLALHKVSPEVKYIL